MTLKFAIVEAARYPARARWAVFQGGERIGTMYRTGGFWEAKSYPADKYVHHEEFIRDLKGWLRRHYEGQEISDG